jgi:hypothetical protein
LQPSKGRFAFSSAKERIIPLLLRVIPPLPKF